MWRLTPFRIALVLGVAIGALRLLEVWVVGWTPSGHEPGVAAQIFRPLELIDMRVMDYRLLQRGPSKEVAPQVVIVAIDDASVDELGRWPWSRARMAQLVDRLVAAGAAVIGFDIVQSEATAACGGAGLPPRPEGVDERAWAAVQEALQTGSSDDHALAEAVRAAGRTVLGYFFDFEAQAAGADAARISAYKIVQHSRSGTGERNLRQAPMARGNLPELSAATREVGYFNFFLDADGSYRRLPLAIAFQDEIALPLSLAMLHVYRPEAPLAIRFADFGVEGVRFGNTWIPVAEDGQMLINYRGPGKTFPHISAADVLAGRVAPEGLRGKLVLVGVTAAAVADVRVTPFSAEMPGVEIHANVLDNILRQDFIQRPKWVLMIEVAVILVAVLVLGIVLEFARGVVAALVAGGLLAGYLVGSQWLFIRQGLPLSVVYPVLAIVATYVAISVQHYVVEEREKRKIRDAFGLYLSPSLARLVSDRPEMLALGGDKRELTVLFSDIRGFTTISEELDPEVLVELLNKYFGEMTDVIFAEDGTLDKYIGDAIMAVWGAPLAQPDHAARACRAALNMVARLATLDEHWKERGWPILDIGIGLNTGLMVVGNMGSERRLSYTVMGDNVNLGSRLEGLNKLYGTRIIASEATIHAATGIVTAREIDLVRVKGKRLPVKIFEILGLAADAERWRSVIDAFAAGIHAYRLRRWDDAIAAFQSVLRERPLDGPARLYLERCDVLRATPPEADWEGVTVMEAK